MLKDGNRHYFFGGNDDWTPFIIYQQVDQVGGAVEYKVVEDSSSENSIWESDRRIVLIEK